MTEARTVQLLILCVVLEPLRYLTLWFLRRGSIVRRKYRQNKGRTPPICDFVWMEGSPATRVLQYYSHLMSGKARRLRLIWGRSYSSFKAWADAEPALLQQFRRACRCASALVHYRFIVGCFALPWLWAALIDHRRSPEDRANVARQIWNMPHELIDLWFSEVLLEWFPNLEMATSPVLLQCLGSWAWTILCTCCQLEFRHSRNRHRANADMRWANFVGQSFNAESFLRFRWQEKVSHAVAFGKDSFVGKDLFIGLRDPVCRIKKIASRI